MDYDFIHDLSQITEILATAIDDLETVKRRSLQLVVPVFSNVSHKLVTIMLEEKTDLLTTMARESFAFLQEYIDGSLYPSIEKRINDEMLALSFLDPFDYKFNMVLGPIKQEIDAKYNAGILPTLMADIITTLENRKKRFETSATEYIKSCGLGDTDEKATDESDESDDEAVDPAIEINHEILRFKKMARKMRKGSFQDDAERLYYESDRSGADIEKFWNNKKCAFTQLSAIALKLLVIPASSAMVESSFLFTRNIQTPGRSQLTDKHIEDILTLFFNVKI